MKNKLKTYVYTSTINDEWPANSYM
jgi:hypothetical protein